MRFPPSAVESAHDWAPERTSAGPERSGGLGGTESCAGGLACDNGTAEGEKLNIVFFCLAVMESKRNEAEASRVQFRGEKSCE
jgi:hypothetical protein